jgi:ketosteroid isomerase-like protein
MKMRGLLLALVALVSFCSATRAQVPAGVRRGDEKVYAALKKLHEDVGEAVVKRDRAALEQFYADEFVYFHSTGGADTKAEWIAKSLTIDPESARLPPTTGGEHELHVYGNVAVMRGHNALTINGQPNPRSLRMTYIYIKRGGRWRIAQMQGTPIPAPRAAVAVDPKILDAYVGEYEYPNGDHVRIVREGDTLTSQRTGRPKVTLKPVGEAQFIIEGTDSQMTLFKDGEGRVTHFTIHRGARGDETAKKIK